MNTKEVYKRVFKKQEDAHVRHVATFDLHQIGDQSPYFSITCDTYDNRERRGGGLVACGCQHDVVAKFFPELVPFIPLHLSTNDGVPMHAEANAWYWAGGDVRWNRGDKNDPPRVDYLANHLRIPYSHAQMLALRVGTSEITRAEFALYVAQQADRWVQEAATAINFLKSA